MENLTKLLPIKLSLGEVAFALSNVELMQNLYPGAVKETQTGKVELNLINTAQIGVLNPVGRRKEITILVKFAAKFHKKVLGKWHYIASAFI